MIVQHTNVKTEYMATAVEILKPILIEWAHIIKLAFKKNVADINNNFGFASVLAHPMNRTSAMTARIQENTNRKLLIF